MTTLDDWIAQYAQLNALNPSLVRNVIKVESGFNPKAISPAGAIGYMQLMPKTAAGLKVDPYNPEQNIVGGTKYLSDMVSKYGLQNGLAAYNWGPGNVDKFLAGKQEMPASVRKYVADVTQANAAATPVTNTPAVTTTGDIKMEPYDDEYTKMALFNPYIQMALGIMAGNSGKSKSEAFSNAMGGGLQSVQSAQQMGLATRKDRREEKKFREEQGASEQVRSWASDMITKDPTNAHYYRMMMASPEIGIKWYDTIKGNEAREKAAEADMIRANKYEPYGGAGFGWTPDFEMSDAQFKNLDKVLSAEFGEAYSALDAEQKRYYAQQYLNAQRYGAKRGQAPGTIEVPQLPQKNPSTWDKAEDLLMRIWESVRGQANGDVGGGWTVRKK